METIAPEHTAVRVALWRALHLLLDSSPHIFTDEIGALIVNEPRWMERPDMEATFSKSMRASVVGRARFIEDLVKEQIQQGVKQYVILGAGIDTFAQRNPEIASVVNIFEIDQPSPQNWKKQRLHELNFPIPKGLHFIPVDFEGGQSWWEQLLTSNFDSKKPAIVVSTGVSMYLSSEANMATLKQLATLVAGSTFAMTFMLTLDLLPDREREIMQFVMKKAAESKTPFKSLFEPAQIVDLAISSGLKKAKYVSAHDLFLRYFANRTDGLNAGSAEAFMVATTA